MKINQMAYSGDIIRAENVDFIVSLNKCVDKINEIIDVLNELTAPTTAKAEEGKILRIDENLHITEFCCDELKRIIEYFGDVKALEAYKRCPYCHALIIWEEKKRVRIALTEEDANELRHLINNQVLLLFTRQDYPAGRNIKEYQEEKMQFYMRIRAEIDHKEPL